MKSVARIRLFFIKLRIILGGGLAKPEVWRVKKALEEVINE